MEENRKTAHTKPQTKLIVLSILLGCVIALLLNYHTKELKRAVRLANQTPNSAFSYALKDIDEVLDNQLKGWNNGNIDQFMEGYIEDSSVRFITSKKVKISRQEITDSYKKGYPNKDAMGKLTFHRDEIRWISQSAAIAQVIGRWEVIQKHHQKTVTGSNNLNNIAKKNSNIATYQPKNDTLSGRFSLIFVGSKNGPKIQIDHTW